MTAITITVIAIAYSNLIQHFPGGGGGYLVATKLLGNRVGVVSGCALLVDYVLTITVSIASGMRSALVVPSAALAVYKLPAEFALIARAHHSQPARRQGVGQRPRRRSFCCSS